MTGVFPFCAVLSRPSLAAASIFTGQIKPILKSEDGVAYLQRLLDEGDLQTDPDPAIYIYQVEEAGQKQIGVWVQIDPAELKVHEQVLPEKVQRIHDFRLRSGLEPKPVLLTYRPIGSIQSLIKTATRYEPLITYTEGEKSHTLWRVTDFEPFKTALEQVNAFYMADGHHRLVGNPFNTLSALLMDTEEIRVKPYHRLISTNKNLEDFFEILDAEGPVLPKRKGHFGLLKNGSWYYLIAKKSQAYDTETLAGLFNDIEYTTDISGEAGKLLFTLSPLSIEEVMSVADAGMILPPKSTWIEPKIPYGLLLCRHGKTNEGGGVEKNVQSNPDN